MLVSVVTHMLRLIEERYVEPLSLAGISVVLGRSKGHLGALFREQTGQSVRALVAQMRVHHGAALIRAGEKIEVASLLVGYRSKKSFCRHFKEEYHLTPSAYRTAVRVLVTPRNEGACQSPSTGRAPGGTPSRSL